MSGLFEGIPSLNEPKQQLGGTACTEIMLEPGKANCIGGGPVTQARVPRMHYHSSNLRRRHSHWPEGRRGVDGGWTGGSGSGRPSERCAVWAAAGVRQGRPPLALSPFQPEAARAARSSKRPLRVVHTRKASLWIIRGQEGRPQGNSGRQEGHRERLLCSASRLHGRGGSRADASREVEQAPILSSPVSMDGSRQGLQAKSASQCTLCNQAGLL